MQSLLKSAFLDWFNIDDTQTRANGDGAAALEIGDDGGRKLFSEQVFFKSSDL